LVADHSSCSDQGSVQSAPSVDWRWNGGVGGAASIADSSTSTWRDGGRSRGSLPSQSSHSHHSHPPPPHHPHYRELSPTRSDTSEQRVYVKTARRVMDDLSRAVGSERRIAALAHVCEHFDHNDEVRHNMELATGALSVLAKALAGAMTQQQHDEEARMIAAALEMVVRGNSKSVHMAYNKVGPALLVQLLRLLDRCELGPLPFKYPDVTILNVTKVLYALSRFADLRVTLCRQPGMLDALERLRTLNADCRLMRMKVIANLASAEDNKVYLYEHAGLVESIVRVAHLDAHELARQYAGAALMDLASAPPNQVPMANDDKILGTLVKMVLVEKSMITRESVITALQNLAFAKENRVRLVSFKDGVLLEALKQALASDMDAKARRRAAGALTNLVCDETAERMGHHKGLLDTLAIVSTKDENLDVQTRASLALTKIANCITVKMDCHETLLDALVVASLSKANNSVSAVLRVKARDPENRETMARHHGVIDTLADICVSEGAKVSDRDNAMRAIMHLINEAKNRKILCNKTVLDALVTGANYNDPDLEEARDSAIRAMERLATEYSNRAVMARQEGLLVAVARAVEREALWEEDGRESEHGYLAKPLLMSLLVAM